MSSLACWPSELCFLCYDGCKSRHFHTRNTSRYHCTESPWHPMAFDTITKLTWNPWKWIAKTRCPGRKKVLLVRKTPCPAQHLRIWVHLFGARHSDTSAVSCSVPSWWIQAYWVYNSPCAPHHLLGKYGNIGNVLTGQFWRVADGPVGSYTSWSSKAKAKWGGADSCHDQKSLPWNYSKIVTHCHTIPNKPLTLDNILLLELSSSILNGPKLSSTICTGDPIVIHQCKNSQQSPTLGLNYILMRRILNQCFIFLCFPACFSMIFPRCLGPKTPLRARRGSPQRRCFHTGEPPELPRPMTGLPRGPCGMFSDCVQLHRWCVSFGSVQKLWSLGPPWKIFHKDKTKWLCWTKKSVLSFWSVDWPWCF